MAGDAPDARAAMGYARRRLETELPSWLRYHDAEHTIGLVVPAAETLAGDLGLGDLDRDLLLTAAWFHDIGFVEQYEANEAIAVAIVGEVLPGFGYQESHVAVVESAIWATQVPQEPASPLAEAMCDADLFVLGTDRFGEREQALRDELAATGVEHTDESWDLSQIAFLEAHRFFTAAARRRGDAGKGANLAMVQRRLADRAGR